MDAALITTMSEKLPDILIYGAIALVTLIGFIKCIYPVARNSRLLNRAIVKLEKSTAAGENPVWRDQRFLGRSLRDEWQQFLLNAGQLDLRGIPCDTRDYINEETVIEQPGHAALADLIPGLLTSLGILGTFIGLIQGLSSVNFSNAEGTIQSIPQMLTGMRFAFATSVAGISCSLAFNMLNRIATGHALRSLTSFEDCFYELAMPRPLDPEVQLLCQKQDEDAAMARIADQICQKLGASLENAVARSLQPVSRTAEQSVQITTQEQVEGVRRVANQFIQQLNVTFGGQLNGVTNAFSNTQHAQSELMQSLNRTMADMRRIAEQTQQLTKLNAEMILQVQSICTQLSDQQNTYTQTIRTAQQTLRSIDDASEKLNAEIDQLQQHIGIGASDADKE